MFFKKASNPAYYLATVAGVLAILLWASNIAFSKSALEQEGYLNGAFLIYFYSGIFVFILLTLFQKRSDLFKSFRGLPLSYYLKIGSFFIVNNVLLFVAVGMAKKNEELVIVTLLNYTWPILIYVFRIPIFRMKISYAIFIPGIIVSFIGISLALIQGYSLDGIGQIIKAGNDNTPAYLLVFIAAVSWALYSNLTVKYKSQDDIAGIPVIFLLSSLVFLIIQSLNGQLSGIHLAGIVHNPDLLYIVTGPTSLGYLFWYIAMKKGNKTLITAFSYFIPLLSLIILWIKFNLEIKLLFWLAVILLITGSYLCYRAFQPSRRYRPPVPH